MDLYRFQCVAVAVAFDVAALQLLLHATEYLRFGAPLCSCSFGSFRAANFVINFCHDDDDGDAKVFRGLSRRRMAVKQIENKMHSVERVRGEQQA